MHFITIATILSGVASAVSTPFELSQGASSHYVPCAGFYGSPVCCGTSVLDAVALDCHTPYKSYKDPVGFRSVCAALGKQPKCCFLPIVGQGVLCGEVQSG
ncbi:magnaporin [Mycena leptocephala]|jgi:hypothetical protein|nr:magnaporin [Mycena leptocephala]